jgi:hypothetical protein
LKPSPLAFLSNRWDQGQTLEWRVDDVCSDLGFGMDDFQGGTALDNVLLDALWTAVANVCGRPVVLLAALIGLTVGCCSADQSGFRSLHKWHLRLMALRRVRVLLGNEGKIIPT